MRLVFAVAAQFVLLAYCYTDPPGRIGPAVAYVPLVSLGSGGLLVRACRAFRQQQLAAALLAALMAFPGVCLALLACDLLAKEFLS